MDINKFFGRHPILAERACIALCRLVAPRVEDVDWREFNIKTKINWRSKDRETVQVEAIREPPIPQRWRLFGENQKLWPKNHCPVCAQPTYQGGDWRKPAGEPRWNKTWHACCYRAHGVWRDPVWVGRWLARRQGGVCPITMEPILSSEHGYVLGGVQIDHVVPLWRVRRLGDQHVWPDVLRFWGLGNLQALSDRGHKIKTAQEARQRAAMGKAASLSSAQLALL